MGAGTHLELLKDSKEARAAEQNEPAREEFPGEIFES